MSTRGVVLFLLLSLVWGIPYTLVSVALTGLHPIHIALGRCAIGGAVLLPIVLSDMQALRLALKAWQAITLFALVEICGPWLLLGYAEQRISSSVAGLSVATVPIVITAILAARHREPVTARQLVGLVVGLTGVAVLLGLSSARAEPLALLALAGVVMGYALGPMVIANSLGEVPGRACVALALVISTSVYCALLPLAPAPSLTTGPVVAVVVLGVVCSAGGFLTMFALVQEVGVGRGSLVTYLNPLVAVYLGIIVLEEPVTAATLTAIPLILGGAWLALDAKPGNRTTAGPSNQARIPSSNP